MAHWTDRWRLRDDSIRRPSELAVLLTERGEDVPGLLGVRKPSGPPAPMAGDEITDALLLLPPEPALLLALFAGL